MTRGIRNIFDKNGILNHPCKDCGCQITRNNMVYNNFSIAGLCHDCWNKFKHRNDRKYLKKKTMNRLHVRNSKLLKWYGITLEEYNEMLIKQGGVCAICNGVNKDGRDLHVDHNHLTGKIRGLLCIDCNFLVHRAKDDRKILERAQEYLFNYDFTPEAYEFIQKQNEYSPG